MYSDTEHPNKDKQVKCDECNKVFQSKSYLTEDKYKAYDGEINCDECDENFACITDFKGHKKSFHVLAKIFLASTLSNFKASNSKLS